MTGSASTGGLDPDGGCAGEATTAQQLPLDMYIMLDQSGSMGDPVQGGGDKWQAVTSALNAFVTQPGLSGISVGIQYFGLPPGGGGPIDFLPGRVRRAPLWIRQARLEWLFRLAIQPWRWRRQLHAARFFPLIALHAPRERRRAAERSSYQHR